MPNHTHARAALLFGAALALGGCSGWQSPLLDLIDGGGSSAPEAPTTVSFTPTPPPSGRPLDSAAPLSAPQSSSDAQDTKADWVVVTAVNADPRRDASDFCERRSRYSKLIGAERINAADPSDDQIRWYFACID